MPILIDTNVLLRSVQPSHPMRAGAVRAPEVLMKREEALVIALQNVAEFWNAATRPAVHNGLGITIEEALEELTKLEGVFQILTENAASYATWKTLLIANRVIGVETEFDSWRRSGPYRGRPRARIQQQRNCVGCGSSG